jgi:surface protein
MKTKLLLYAQLFFVCQFAIGQDFITTWENFSYSSGGTTSISFNVLTAGTVLYSWQTIPSGQSGTGSFSTGIAVIDGIPTNSIIRLSIQPQNLRRFSVINMNYFNSLRSIIQWGAVPWTSFENAFQVIASPPYNVPFEVIATDVPNLTNVTSLANMFEGLAALNSPFNLNSWNVSTITNMSGMFRGCANFNQTMSLWNTSNVTNMAGMFDGAENFNLNIGNWNTARVTNMSNMFRNAYNFNRNIGNWNTGNVTDMSGMFEIYNFNNYSNSFNQNIGNWNTSQVRNMSRMFFSAENFNQNIGNWNTTNVTDMSMMFTSAKAFNQNIGAWNVANVTTMEGMFLNMPNSFNLNITNYAFNNGGSNSIQIWNTSKVTNMSEMFLRANNFNQNLGNWTLNPAVVLTNMLNSSGLSCSNYSGTLIGWNANPNTPNNKILGATFMEYGPEAQAAVNNLTSVKSWGFSGHDLLIINPSFTIQNTVCLGSTSPVLTTTSLNGITGIWSPSNINNQSSNNYTFTPTAGQCAQPFTLNVTVNPIDAPSGNSTQAFGSGSTISNIVISPPTVLWYASSADANSNVNVLPANTLLINGNTYFAVNDNGQCRSQPFAVVANVTLNKKSFDVKTIRIFPNPATTALQISHSDRIETVQVYSILGQLLIEKTVNANVININVSGLAPSIYLLRIKSNNQVGEMKFIKQ